MWKILRSKKRTYTQRNRSWNIPYPLILRHGYIRPLNVTAFKLSFTPWTPFQDDILSQALVYYPHRSTTDGMVIVGANTRPVSGMSVEVMFPVRIFNHIISEAQGSDLGIPDMTVKDSTEFVPVKAIPHQELWRGIEVQEGRALVGFRTLCSQPIRNVNLLGGIRVVDMKERGHELFFSVIYAEVEDPERYRVFYRTDAEFRYKGALTEETNGWI